MDPGFGLLIPVLDAVERFLLCPKATQMVGQLKMQLKEGWKETGDSVSLAVTQACSASLFSPAKARQGTAGFTHT